MEHIEEPQRKEHSKFITWSLIVAIIIVMNLFFNYGISLFYKLPVYENYCPDSLLSQNYTTKAECTAVGGQWTESQITPTAPGSEPQKIFTAPECNPTYTCENTYENAQNIYSRNVFTILVILGVLTLVGGAFVPIDILGLAFSWAGVLSLFIASVRYWGEAGNLTRVIILALALGALIWLAIKKFRK